MMNSASHICIAHVRQSDHHIQSVQTHLTETAAIAKQLAAKLDLDLAGELLGLMHDFGKYSTAFQEYIQAATGINPDVDWDTVLPNGKKIDHSTAGAQWVYRCLKDFDTKKGRGELCGQILGLCIASHHGAGLIDCLNPEDGDPTWLNRFQKDDALTHLNECLQQADAPVLARAQTLAQSDLLKQMWAQIKAILLQQKSDKIKDFHLGCLTRFLFSCLIDADRINSADFERQNQASMRRLNQQPDWQALIDTFEAHLANFKPEYDIDFIRKRISDDCLSRAQDPQNIYTLTVPTGGGKTLASLRYALHHAKKHQLDRIIYIIPYTSIIDQNARVVRKILGEENVLEHHSNLNPEQQTWQNKLLSENWDKPIVFTTMVQFLDAWFGSGTRGARHIHPMTRSVLIFDEIQTLPVKCVHLFCNVLNWLVQFGKSSAVLCTATQPLLDKLPKSEFGELVLPENAEIMGDTEANKQLFDELSRVNIRFHDKAGGWSVDEAGEFLLKQVQEFNSCLFIVNTKKWAQQLYQYCQQHNVPKEALFHLSTNQCPEHREALFETMKARLAKKEPVVCISTQLIEAGVDISMACVIRALAGLDSIAQAAGRCNRHGELKQGTVWVLDLQNEPLDKLPDIQEGKRIAHQRVFKSEEFAGRDILQPDVMRRYFEYYFYQRGGQMAYPLGNNGNLMDWLSDNCRNAYGEKNHVRIQKGQYPLLMQSFKSAGKAFQVIDAPTQALIVPYGEKGKALIGHLCGEYDPKQFYTYLRQAQRLSVNVFPHIWKQLEDAGAIYPIADTGVYYLDERHYSDEYGLSVDEAGFMSCWNV